MSAIFSEDRVYRYSLYRDWPMAKWRDGSVMFVGLNPSTADEVKDDPTIRRCRGFAKAWGYQSMFMRKFGPYEYNWKTMRCKRKP